MTRSTQCMRTTLLIMLAGAAATSALAWLTDAAGVVPSQPWNAWWIYGLTETGSAHWVPLVLLLLLAAWASDAALPQRYRRREALVLFVLLGVTLPALALVNERILKPQVKAHRPSHTTLAAAGVIPNLAEFYRLDKESRQQFLTSQLDDATATKVAAALGIPPLVLQVWIQESAASFPSGHALNAFLAATLFVGAAVGRPTRRRRLLAGTMLVWALGVSWSRVLLLVHRPPDVSFGALLGVGCGVLLVLVWQRCLPFKEA